MALTETLTIDNEVISDFMLSSIKFLEIIMNIEFTKPKLLKNLSYNELFFHELDQKGCLLTAVDCVHVNTGKYKGRTPKDRYIVKNPESQNNIDWGDINQPLTSDVFDDLLYQTINHLQNKNKIFVFEGYAGADINNRVAVRIYTEKSWQSHFCKNMFIEASTNELKEFKPDFTIINASSFKNQNWRTQGLNSDTYIAFNIEKRLGIIGGTEYGGEMKKGIFAMMNYFLPLKNILTMHCAANTDSSGKTAVFFGLSGTGKTSLSTDSKRDLIGDDEHAWTDDGIFNIEGGCYAKTAGLKEDYEPEIYRAIRRNALLENISFATDGSPDYVDTSLTENGRVSYPLSHLEHIHPQSSVADHPQAILFLTCDSYGVLPPVSILSEQQALYQFIAGYTSKVAGTEQGVKEPVATFSSCYGAPFMPLHPFHYGKLLLEKIRKYNIPCYLINTGWVEGPYYSNGADKGHRISIKCSRSIVDACINGSIKAVDTEIDELGFEIPTQIKGVDSRLLNPKKSWSDLQSYRKQVNKLKTLFEINVSKFKGQLVDYGLEEFEYEWRF